MKEKVESWTQQGNPWFLAGNKSEAITCYYHALKQSGALKSVVKYVQKNKDNLFEDQEMLQELLYTKYHMHLVHHALSLILISTKNQVEEIEETKEYQRFKKLILSKHPKSSTQFVDVFPDEFENESCKERGFLSKLLIEQGMNYSLCDANRLCNLRSQVKDLDRFEGSLQERPQTFTQIDSMSGHEFEDFVMDLLIKLRYRIVQQKRSHEQGLDLLLERHGERIACQVKRYKKPVGNKGVQQAIAAREFYRCQRALVVTNSHFTTPAKQLAERCNVELWDREVLKEKIKIVM
ncbi:MAG: restriction endonuclease [Candidatus Thermoplasmatota archaeon]|nr:restriction endonuclease [Candidatus Thermoplasmatota archaeon]